MEEEIWKDIPGYEGMYQVSSEGRVKSLERYVGNNGGLQVVKERYLIPGRGSRGYFNVSLAKSGKSKTYAIHILVAIVFLNHIPCDMKIVVDHIKSSDKSDNRLSNLQLITQRKNSSKDKKSDSGFTGVYKTKNGRYRSRILYGKKKISLGTFDTPEEAHEAYLNKLKEIEVK